MVDEAHSNIPLPKVPDLRTPLELSRLSELLAANERLDLLRDRSEYIQERYGQRPKTFYEVCLGGKLPDDKTDARKLLQKYTRSELIMSSVIGAALGVAFTHVYRTKFPKRSDIGYLGGIMTGGTLGYTFDTWQQNRAVDKQVDERIDGYERYLNEFERKMQETQQEKTHAEAVDKAPLQTNAKHTI